MKRCLALVLSLVLILAAAWMPASNIGTKVEAASFTDMNQSAITSAMGLGWNLGNQLEANSNGTPSETAWGNPTITSSIFTAVKNAGFSTVRIPVSWLSYIGSGSSYTVDSSWMARVKEVVDMAIDAGLYVVINVHGDGYSTVTGGWLLPGASDQTTIVAKFKALWTQIATTFKDYDHHLIFEGMNEIGADANYDWETVYSYYTNINTYNQTFVDAVRATGGNNQKRWLIVTGWNTNIDYTVSEWQNFVLPTDSYNSSPRIMVSVHYYSPWEFCGDESYDVTGWGSSASSTAGWGNEDYMVEQLSAMYNKFVSAGYPVFIGEFGCIDKGNTDMRVYWAKTFVTYAKQYGCIPVWWDNGYNGTYGFGLFDRSSATQTQSSIISAMVSAIGGSSSSSTTTTTTTTTTQATTTTTTAASSSSGTSGLDGYYYIKAKSSQLYLNTSGDSSANSAAIVHETGDGAMAQRFKLVSTGTSGVYYIYTGASDYTKVIDISGKSSADGASVIQYTYNGNTNQQFKLVKVGNYYAILTGVSGYASCLDVYGWSTTAGDPIKQWTYWGGDCQLYTLESCSSGSSSGTTTTTTTTTTKAATTTTTTTTQAATTTTTASSSSSSDNYVVTIKTSGSGSSLTHITINGYHLAINGGSGTYWENAAASNGTTFYIPKSQSWGTTVDFKTSEWGSVVASWSGTVTSDITLTFNGSSVTQS